jgi:hypothetical protein
MEKIKKSSICLVQYRDAKGRFVKAPQGAKTVVLKPTKRKAKIIKASEGPKVKITGSGKPGAVYRVRVFDPEINRLEREARAQGGDYYKDFLKWKRQLKKEYAIEASKMLRERRERELSNALEKEFLRERASRGGQNAAKTKKAIKEKSSELDSLSTSQLLSKLKTGSRIERKAAAVTLKKRGIESTKRRKKK